MKDGLAYSAMKILSQYIIELYRSWPHKYLESTRGYLKKINGDLPIDPTFKLKHQNLKQFFNKNCYPLWYRIIRFPLS